MTQAAVQTTERDWMRVPVLAGRLPLVAAAGLLLLTGTWAGLLRMGWNWPAVPVMAIVYHGPLMVGGFLGTLISLERAVALRRWWAYGAPLASAAGGIVLAAGQDPRAGQWLLLVASALLVLVFVRIAMLQLAGFTVIMGVGAGTWLIGNLCWMATRLVPVAVPWWMAFLTLTIVGERLELSRLLPRSRWREPTFLMAAGLYLAGVVVGAWFVGLGLAISGLGLFALAAWLSIFDLARRTIRLGGLPRFTAACLLSGYVWLAVAGALSITLALLPAFRQGGPSWLYTMPTAGLEYDAILHALFLGFVFAMIFGHAPIIFPAVLSIRMEFRRRYYVHLWLLQFSVLLRVVCDLGGSAAGRQWAGILNALAIILFLVNTMCTVRRPTHAEVRG